MKSSRASPARQTVLMARSRHSHFDGSISCICEIVAAFAELDGGDEITDVSPRVFEGALLSDAHPGLGLGEGLFDRIEVAGTRAGRRIIWVAGLGIASSQQSFVLSIDRSDGRDVSIALVCSRRQPAKVGESASDASGRLDPTCVLPCYGAWTGVRPSSRSAAFSAIM